MSGGGSWRSPTEPEPQWATLYCPGPPASPIDRPAPGTGRAAAGLMMHDRYGCRLVLSRCGRDFDTFGARLLVTLHTVPRSACIFGHRFTNCPHRCICCRFSCGYACSHHHSMEQPIKRHMDGRVRACIDLTSFQ